MHKKEKKVIVFEGIDGCGKTTVLNTLYAKLIEEGKTCKILTTPLMINNIRDILKVNTAEKYDLHAYEDALASVMYADKVSAIMPGGILYEEIMNDETEIILMDRFIHSYFVYNYMKCVDDSIIALNTIDNKIDAMMKPLRKRASFYYVYLKLDSNDANSMIDSRGDTREYTEIDKQDNKGEFFDALFTLDRHMRFPMQFMRIGKDFGPIHIETKYPMPYIDMLITYNQKYESGERATPLEITMNLKSYIIDEIWKNKNDATND